MTSSQQNNTKEGSTYKVRITYDRYSENLDSNWIDYRYLLDNFGINLGKNKDRNPIILAIDIRPNGEIIVTKNSFTTLVHVKTDEREPWKILLVSDAFELKAMANIKIDHYELKMEKILVRKSPKRIITSDRQKPTEKIDSKLYQNDQNKPIKKNDLTLSSSQDSGNSKSNNIWDFLDEILEEEKKQKESNVSESKSKEKIKFENKMVENDILNSIFPKRKPIESHQKAFEKLEEIHNSNKKYKSESSVFIENKKDSDSESFDIDNRVVSNLEKRLSQTPNNEKNSQENSKLKRLKKFVADKREENVKNSVTKMQTQIKQEAESEPCSICLSDIVEFLGKLENCSHRFCFSCIKDWSDVTNECPLCKRRFEILTKCETNGKELEIIQVKFKRQVYEDNLEEFIENIDDGCYECGGAEDPHLLLICDECGFNCCHTYCCDPPLDTIPLEDWFCKFCSRPSRRNRRRGAGASAGAGAGNRNRNTNRNASNSNTNLARNQSSRTGSRGGNSNTRNQSRNRSNNERTLLETLFEQAEGADPLYDPFFEEEALYDPFQDEIFNSSRSNRNRETSNSRTGRNTRNNHSETQSSLDLKIESRSNNRSHNQFGEVSLNTLNNFRFPTRNSEKYL